MMEPAPVENAGEIIELFGGIRPMASKMRVPVTTVQGWKKRGAIPGARRADLLEAARINGVDVSPFLGGSVANGNRPSTESGSSSGEPADAAVLPDPDPVPETDPLPAPPPFLQANSSGSSNPSANPSVKSSAGAKRSEGGAIPSAHEKILQDLHGVEKRAIRKSVWISGVLLACTAGLGAFLVLPVSDQVSRHEGRITGLESDVSHIKATPRGLLPEGWSPEDLRDRVSAIQKTVADVTRTAEEMSETLLSPDGGSLAERVSRLERQVTILTDSPALSDLLGRVDGFRQTVEGQAKLAESLSQLRGIVGDMEGRMEGFNAALADARLQSDALGDTFEGVSQEDLKAAALLVGLSQFRQSLDRDQTPFAEDLALLTGMVGENNPELLASLERLAPHAESGVLTKEGLSKEFRGLAGEMVVASLKGEDVPVQERAKARLGELLMIQKDGEPLTGTDTQIRVARAESHLEQGNILEAIGELRNLEGAAAEVAAPFIEKASATLQAEQAKTLIQQFIALRGRSTPGGAPKYTARPRGLSGIVPAPDIIVEPDSGMAVRPAR